MEPQPPSLPPPTPSSTPPRQAPRSSIHFDSETATEKGVKSGRGWILAVACLQLAGAFINYLMYSAQLGNQLDDPGVRAAVFLECGIIFALGLIFLGIWIWSKWSPFPASITALALYVSAMALTAVLSPETIFHGIILKVIIVVSLSQAVKKSYALKREQEEAQMMARNGYTP